MLSNTCKVQHIQTTDDVFYCEGRALQIYIYRHYSKMFLIYHTMHE